VSALIDTKVLVYRYDSRDPEKQRIARRVLRDGIERDALRGPHQAEELLSQFEILYPTEPLLRTAIRAVATYQLGWFDAHMWVYAEHYGLDELLSGPGSQGES